MYTGRLPKRVKMKTVGPLRVLKEAVEPMYKESSSTVIHIKMKPRNQRESQKDKERLKSPLPAARIKVMLRFLRFTYLA